MDCRKSQVINVEKMKLQEETTWTCMMFDLCECLKLPCTQFTIPYTCVFGCQTSNWSHFVGYKDYCLSRTQLSQTRQWYPPQQIEEEPIEGGEWIYKPITLLLFQHIVFTSIQIMEAKKRRCVIPRIVIDFVRSLSHWLLSHDDMMKTLHDTNK